jgi:hypothetical protein
MDGPPEDEGEERLVRVNAGAVTLEGNLNLPERARAVVLFAHGSGSSRHSPRNRYVARVLNAAKLGTLLIDLLTPEVEAIDLQTAHLRFDVGLLAGRLVAATDWLLQAEYRTDRARETRSASHTGRLYDPSRHCHRRFWLGRAGRAKACSTGAARQLRDGVSRHAERFSADLGKR